MARREPNSADKGDKATKESTESQPEQEFEIPENVDYEFPQRPVIPPSPSSKRARVEEVADEEDVGRFARVFPKPVAEALGMGNTEFEEILQEQKNMGLEDNPEAPFMNREEWELAEWLTKRVNKAAIDEYLKLPIVSEEKNLRLLK